MKLVYYANLNKFLLLVKDCLKLGFILHRLPINLHLLYLLYMEVFQKSQWVQNEQKKTRIDENIWEYTLRWTTVVAINSSFDLADKKKNLKRIMIDWPINQLATYSILLQKIHI